MARLTDMQVAMWQEEPRIEPVTEERAELLRKLSAACFDTIKFIELELAGIRARDQRGSDLFELVMNGLFNLCAAYREAKSTES